MNWPPPGRGDSYDMNGLDLRGMFLRARTTAKPEETGGVPYKSCMNGITSGCADAPGGSLIRGIWGQYLPFDKEFQDGLLPDLEEGQWQDLGRFEGHCRP